MMECSEARRLIAAQIDGELDAADAAALAAHLETCAACARHLAEQQAWRGIIKSRAPRHAAPAALRSRLAAALDEADRPAPPAARRSTAGWRPFAMAASVVLAVLLSSSLTAYLTRPGDDDRLVRELVSDHIRSLMADHLTDVASSDQHTVKPWFHGRLDLAPPVDDLAADGYPLVGGRLDYVEEQPVAALVYRHAEHPINVFVLPNAARPAGAAQSAAQATTQRGFNVLHWTRGDLSFWAVSDLNLGELRDFQRLFDRGMAAAG
jgi:mycothiol system anti-sigma-R factor